MSWHGHITSIFVEQGAVLCNVKHSDRVDVESTAVPILTSFSGEMVVPELGQKVVVGDLEDGTEYIEGVLTTDGEDLPDLSESEINFRFNDDTHITVSKNQSGNYDVDISTDGNVVLNEIPFSDHTHSYYDSTGDGGSDRMTDPPE